MKLTLVITQTNPEVVFNAFRLANFSLKEGDKVNIFLLAEGVELERVDNARFDVRGQAETFLKSGGEILACGTCLKLRDSQGTELCPMSTMKDLYALTKESDRVLTF